MKMGARPCVATFAAPPCSFSANAIRRSASAEDADQPRAIEPCLQSYPSPIGRQKVARRSGCALEAPGGSPDLPTPRSSPSGRKPSAASRWPICSGSTVSVGQRSPPGARATAGLDQLVALHGRPRARRRDNGPEFIAEPLATWCAAQGIALTHIQLGQPNQNAYIERFNRTYRYAVLDAWLFTSLQEARAVTADWLTTYNTKRPHDRLGGMPPLDLIPRPISAPFVSELTVSETGRATPPVDRHLSLTHSQSPNSL